MQFAFPTYVFILPPRFIYVKSLSKHCYSSQPNLSLSRVAGLCLLGTGSTGDHCAVFSALLHWETRTAGFQRNLCYIHNPPFLHVASFKAPLGFRCRVSLSDRQDSWVLLDKISRGPDWWIWSTPWGETRLSNYPLTAHSRSDVNAHLMAFSFRIPRHWENQ